MLLRIFLLLAKKELHVKNDNYSLNPFFKLQFEINQSFNQCRRSRLDPWDKKIPGIGNGYPLQDSCLDNSVDRGTWCTIVHGVT